MSSLFDLMGEVAIVTGSTDGIGRTQAISLADAGADVVVISRRLEHLKKVSEEIKAKDRKSLVVSVDVTDGKPVADMVDNVSKTSSHIDILVNAHGLAIRKPAETFSINEWQHVINSVWDCQEPCLT